MCAGSESEILRAARAVRMESAAAQGRGPPERTQRERRRGAWPSCTRRDGALDATLALTRRGTHHLVHTRGTQRTPYAGASLAKPTRTMLPRENHGENHGKYHGKITGESRLNRNRLMLVHTSLTAHLRRDSDVNSTRRPFRQPAPLKILSVNLLGLRPCCWGFAQAAQDAPGSTISPSWNRRSDTQSQSKVFV